MAETVSRRRPLEDEDEDDDMEAKKQRGVSYVDISNKLVDMIANIGDKASTIESSLENIVATIYPEISNYEPQILDALSQCVAYKPEKLSIYSALVGLLNARNFEFGGSVVSKLVADLDETFRTEKFDISLRIITFLSDLANARVLTLQSVLEFLESFIELTIDENLRTDFFVYAVMHALPWVGPELHEKKPKELSNILDGIEYYLNRRKKLHSKILQVWLNNEDHEQEDHLDSLWLQIKKLREEDWLERHITRIYVAFEPILADSLQHNLPSIEIPPYSFDVNYPLPRIVFRLFSPSDVPDTEPALPGSHSIDRFLVEEDVAWIIDNNHLNWRVCAQELLNYHKKDSAPLNYVIIEVIFGQLFRLPEPPYLPIFYGALLIEFCRIQPNSMPQVLAQAAEMLYQRVESMQSVCIDRFVDWFSYHLSNFQYRWSWSEWSDCLELDSLSPKLIFVREVLEKCMRLAYHSKVVEFLPEEFDRIIPPEPTIIFVLDDNTHPAYAQAQEFKNLIRGRIDADEMLDKLRRKEPSGEVGESEYDPDSVAVFTAVLLKLASKTFSHSFAALTKYHNTYRAVTSGSDEMQSVVLRTLYDCWNRHKQMMTVLVDKMLKMQILECSIIVAWVFCDDMKREFKRSWVWETLNTAITRLSRQVQVLRTNVETSKKKHRKLKEKLESTKKEKNEEEEGEIGMETDDKWGNEDEDQHMDDEKLRDLEEQISKNTLEYERFEENFRNVLLDVCHKFTVLLTEHLLNCDTENTPVETDWYIYTTGRFKHVFLAMTAYIDAHRLVLQGLNERKLFKLMDVSDTEFIQFLQKIGLLNSKKTCDGCGEQMFDRWRKKRNDRYRIWRCYKHGCKKEKGFFVGTFFEGAKLEPKQVFWILYKWSRGYTKQKDLIFESTRESGKREGKSLSSSTIVDWLNFCRDIAAIWCSSYNSKIGGPAKIVEIDETVITKRKYNRGRLVKEQIWLFGGVERGGTACFLVMLVDYNGNSLPRNAATLLPIIQRYVIPGSTIMSDCWPAYGGIQNLPEAYQYLKVNHTYNFVDPDTGAHTQTIESTWQKLKQKHKERYGTNRKLFGTYIVEFLFRRKFNGPDMLYHMCQFITKHYPVEIDERMITVPKENAEADVPNQSLGFLEDLDFDPNNPEHVEDVMEPLEDDGFEFMNVDEFFADDYQVEEFNFENFYE